MQRLLRYPFFQATVLLLCGKIHAQSLPAAKDTAYLKMIDQRAAKIVTGLHLADAAQSERVKNSIAEQYFQLNEIDRQRDSAIKSIKAQATGKEAIAAQTQALDEAINTKLDALHAAYLSKLSKELTPQQVDAVKDGMTYNVVNVTYNGYLQMLPNLTDAQKTQIMAWLVEAREHAMDAGSSEKKHAWFGKYKGRINNYLSAQGYDVKKAGEDWAKRRNNQ